MTPSSSPRSSAQHAGRGDATQSYPKRGPTRSATKSVAPGTSRLIVDEPTASDVAMPAMVWHADALAGGKPKWHTWLWQSILRGRFVRASVVLPAPDNNRPIVVGSRRCRRTTQHLAFISHRGGVAGEGRRWILSAPAHRKNQGCPADLPGANRPRSPACGQICRCRFRQNPNRRRPAARVRQARHMK
jgi:hypothetical protein